MYFRVNVDNEDLMEWMGLFQEYGKRKKERMMRQNVRGATMTGWLKQPALELTMTMMYFASIANKQSNPLKLSTRQISCCYQATTLLAKYNASL